MRERIGVALRRAVARRAQSRCEYCGVPDTATLLPHEPDHIVAVQHGGKTALENLAYACFECNRFKGVLHSDEHYVTSCQFGSHWNPPRNP